MTSKAEYLKKYASKEKKEKKKDRKKQKDGQIEGGRDGGTSLLVVDDDNDWGEGRGKDDLNIGDDKPIVADISTARQRGAWSIEETKPGSGGVQEDSDSDADVPRRSARTRHDSDSDSDSDVDVPRRPSAKSAASRTQTGLISSSEFKDVEKDLLRKREEEMKGIDEVAMGRGGETVYRDESGNKVDTMSEYLRKEAVDKGIAIRLEKAQKNISQGGVQQRERQEIMDEMEKVAVEGFSRSVDNERIEALRKEQVREGDPMADYFAKRKKSKKSSSSSNRELEEGPPSEASDTKKTGLRIESSSKPRYTGPPPAPNRFNIMPGFRWDAVDRGNHYEAKVLLVLNKSKEQSEQSYRASVADM